MKKILIIALMCAPMLSFAQTKTTDAAAPSGKSTAALPKEYTPESIFGTLIVFENNARTSIRMDFGRELGVSLKDKDLVLQIETLRETQFLSIPDAINFLSSQGYRLVNSFNFTNNGKIETHFLFEKRVTKAPGTGEVGGVQRPPANPAPRDPAARPNPGAPADTKTKEKK
ncbi:MAG: hypothetical protein SGI87_07980 [Flavobacteriales bacterium]|nr:hypothetical protein [Flavobacteriales bacterium]